MNMSAKREHHRCGFANEALQEINMVKYDDKAVERQDIKWQIKKHKG